MTPQSPFFKVIFYCTSLAASIFLYKARFWRRLGNYFFIVICLGIVEFVMGLLYYPLMFLLQQEVHSAADPVVPKDDPVDLLIFIGLPIVMQILLMPFFICLWQTAVQYINLKILIQLVLATSLSGSGVLYVFPQFMGKIGWIFVFLGTLLSILLFFRGIHQIRMSFHLHQKEKEMFYKNLDNYKAGERTESALATTEPRYRRHLQTISYLLTEGENRRGTKVYS